MNGELASKNDLALCAAMNWIEPVQAIALLLLGGLVTFLFQRRLEGLKAERTALDAARARLHDAESRLRDERRRVYLQVLDPYVAVLQALGTGVSAHEASIRLGTLDHRKAAFELKLVGTDEVVHAFNKFHRYIVDAPSHPHDPPGTILKHWAEFLLAIRRNVGDPNTSITQRDMILDWVADIDTLYPSAPGRAGFALPPAV